MTALRCREARNEMERAACARLRADVYVQERRWVPADRADDGLERDVDDARSVHLLATRGLEPVGTARLILRVAGQPLPAETMLDEPLPAGRAAAEVSRLAVARHARGDSEVLIVLCAGLYASAVDRGIDDLYAMVEKRLHRHLVYLGFPFRAVGAARWVYESWNFPVAMEVIQAKARLMPVLAQYADLAAEEMFDVRAA